MVTELSGAGSNYPVVGQVSMAVSSGADTISESGAGATPEVERSPPAIQSTQVTGTFARLQEQQGLFGQAAATVRETGNAVQQATGLLAKAKQGLTEIVKMYPPYPVDSAQRAAILNEVSGLRKQVEQLTFPPPESLRLADQVLGQQYGNTNPAGVQHVADEVKRGISGLATLNPTSASDSAVSNALGQVESLQSKLQDASTGMWRDVAGFVAQAGTPEAVRQGVAIRQQLAGQNGLGIGSNGNLLQLAAETK